MYREGKEKSKTEACHSRQVGDRPSKQGNLLMRLLLGGHRINRSLHLPSRILRIYREALMVSRERYNADGLNNITFSKMHPRSNS